MSKTKAEDQRRLYVTRGTRMKMDHGEISTLCLLRDSYRWWVGRPPKWNPSLKIWRSGSGCVLGGRLSGHQVKLLGLKTMRPGPKAIVRIPIGKAVKI